MCGKFKTSGAKPPAGTRTGPIRRIFRISGLSRASSVWRVRVGEEVRVRHQTESQERAENCVECKAEAGPPRGDAGVCNEEVVDEVKDAVAHQVGDYNPEIPLETENDEQGKAQGNSDFDPEGALRSAHDGKQDVVGGDHDEDGGIEGTIAVPADEDGEAGDGERARKTKPQRGAPLNSKPGPPARREKGKVKMVLSLRLSHRPKLCATETDPRFASVDLRQWNDQAADFRGGRIFDEDAKRGGAGPRLHVFVEEQAGLEKRVVLLLRHLKIERFAGIEKHFAGLILLDEVNVHGASAHGAVRRQMNMMRVNGTLDF